MWNLSQVHLEDQKVCGIHATEGKFRTDLRCRKAVCGHPSPGQTLGAPVLQALGRGWEDRGDLGEMRVMPGTACTLEEKS